MQKPDLPGNYKVEIFNGERSDPYFSVAYWDGNNWRFKAGTKEYNHHWHPNALVLSFTEMIQKNFSYN